MSLSDEVAQLEDELDHALERAAQLEKRNIELAAEADMLDWQQDVFDLIADVKRGVITIDELYERTVGR